jgi:hypothetical protein
LGRFESDRHGHPVSMALGRSPLMASVFAHEWGHYLDLAILGSPGTRASVTRHEDVLPVTNAIYASRAPRLLQDLYRAGFSPEPHPAQGITNVPIDKEYIRYSLKTQELWSRAYAQYLALRSGDATLRAEIDSLRDPTPGRVYRDLQWADDDFAPIADAFDDLLRRHLWRR